MGPAKWTGCGVGPSKGEETGHRDSKREEDVMLSFQCPNAQIANFHRVSHNRGGGGRARRHLLGGREFLLYLQVSRIHTNSSVVAGGGGGIPLLSRHLTLSLRRKSSLRKLGRNRGQSSLAIPAGCPLKCDPG